MIHPGKYYTPQELEDLGKDGFFPVKEKITIIKLINSGQIPAINISVNPKLTYWKIKGEDILAFLDLRGTYSIKEGEQWNKDAKNKTTKTKKKSGVS